MNIGGRPDDQDLTHGKVPDRAGASPSFPEVGCDDALNQLNQFPASVRNTASCLRAGVSFGLVFPCWSVIVR